MTRELNTLLTALYVVIDDHVVEARIGRGRAPLLSDSELITLAVAQILQGYHSERRWIRHIRDSPVWRAMFPYLPDQSDYHLSRCWARRSSPWPRAARPGSTTCG